MDLQASRTIVAIGQVRSYPQVGSLNARDSIGPLECLSQPIATILSQAGAFQEEL